MQNHFTKGKISFLVLTVMFTLIYQLRAQNDITGHTYAGMYGGHVYYISNCTSNWYDANTAAAEMGGYLANIADLDENSFVQSIVSADGAWIGFHISSTSNGEPQPFDNVSFQYEYDNGWDLGGFGVIFPNGLWALYFGGSNSIHQAYIVEFDSNPDCNNPNKTYICHNGNTICVNTSSLQNHLNHGDFEGPCGPCNSTAMQTLPEDESEIAGHSITTPTVVSSERVKERDGVLAITTSDQIRVFPNPATEEIHVMLPNEKKEGMLRILSFTGHEVQTLPLRGQQSFSLDLSGYIPGVYLIDVRDANGQYQIKFVKL